MGDSKSLRMDSFIAKVQNSSGFKKLLSIGKCNFQWRLHNKRDRLRFCHGIDQFPNFALLVIPIPIEIPKF